VSNPAPDSAPVSSPSRSFGSRLIGALTLDAEAYRDAARDPRALVQAALVVLAGGAARGLGDFARNGFVGFAWGIAIGFVLWGVSALVVRAAGKSLLGRTPDVGALLRALGFAAAPLVGLALIAVVPAQIGAVVFVLAHAAAVLAAAVAVRDACETTAVRALLICLLALLLGLAAALVIGLLFAGGQATAPPPA
jgi:hypothetical protein